MKQLQLSIISMNCETEYEVWLSGCVAARILFEKYIMSRNQEMITWDWIGTRLFAQNETGVQDTIKKISFKPLELNTKVLILRR